jgi:hypothetical protein
MYSIGPSSQITRLACRRKKCPRRERERVGRGERGERVKEKEGERDGDSCRQRALHGGNTQIKGGKSKVVFTGCYQIAHTSPLMSPTKKEKFLPEPKKGWGRLSLRNLPQKQTEFPWKLFLPRIRYELCSESNARGEIT